MSAKHSTSNAVAYKKGRKNNPLNFAVANILFYIALF